ADAGLAHARRPHQQHDRAADFAFVGTNREELKDAVLDVIKARVVFIEHFARVFEEELSLVLADLAVNFRRNLFLQARDFDFLAQHRQDFLHTLEHRHAIEHFLQLDAGGGGQGGGEVGEGRWIVGTEAVEIILQLFAVQRVERQQLLDRVDQGHAIRLDLIGRLVGLVRVFDFHQERRAMVFEPSLDAHTAQALSDELQFAVLAAG
nr:hypothetical protein [Tanacetum cinerariifolium]